MCVGFRDCVIGLIFLRDFVKTTLFLRHYVNRIVCVMRESVKKCAWFCESIQKRAWFRERHVFLANFCIFTWKSQFFSLIAWMREKGKKIWMIAWSRTPLRASWMSGWGARGPGKRGALIENFLESGSESRILKNSFEWWALIGKWVGALLRVELFQSFHILLLFIFSYNFYLLWNFQGRFLRRKKRRKYRLRGREVLGFVRWLFRMVFFGVIGLIPECLTWFLRKKNHIPQLEMAIYRMPNFKMARNHIRNLKTARSRNREPNINLGEAANRKPITPTP